MSTYKERKKKFSLLHFFCPLNRTERKREFNYSTSFSFSFSYIYTYIYIYIHIYVYIYIYICIYMCVIHHHNIVLVVASEQKSEWKRKAWLWLMWIARGYRRWFDHKKCRNSNNNFFCIDEEKKRNARLVVILLMDLSKSNIAWIKIIVDIIVAWLTSWFYLSCQPFAYYPTTRDKQLLFSSSLFFYLSFIIYNDDDLLLRFTTLIRGEEKSLTTYVIFTVYLYFSFWYIYIYFQLPCATSTMMMHQVIGTMLDVVLMTFDSFVMQTKKNATTYIFWCIHTCTYIYIYIYIYRLFKRHEFVFQFYSLGPATVRMISENGPAFPLPLHLPPGHMVQQVLDENGVLTHVIMSQPAPPPPPPPPHHHVVRHQYYRYTLSYF
jgi:hypothetical protein